MKEQGGLHSLVAPQTVSQSMDGDKMGATLKWKTPQFLFSTRSSALPAPARHQGLSGGGTAGGPMHTGSVSVYSSLRMCWAYFWFSSLLQTNLIATMIITLHENKQPQSNAVP